MASLAYFGHDYGITRTRSSMSSGRYYRTDRIATGGGRRYDVLLYGREITVDAILEDERRDTVPKIQQVERQLSRFQEWLVNQHSTLLILVVGGFLLAFTAVAGFLWFTGRFSPETAGYGGVWLMHFIGAASIVVPVPSLLALCAASAPEVGLSPLILGLLAGSGESLGEITGYAVGLSGRKALRNNRWYPKLKGIMERYGGKALFFVGVIPNPVFDVMGFIAGSLAYPVSKFMVILLLAKTIKNIGLAYACYFGISLIFA